MNQTQRLARRLRRPIVKGLIKLDGPDHNIVVRHSSGRGWWLVWYNGSAGGGVVVPRWKDVEGALWLLQRGADLDWFEDERAWRVHFATVTRWYPRMVDALRDFRALVFAAFEGVRAQVVEVAQATAVRGAALLRGGDIEGVRLMVAGFAMQALNASITAHLSPAITSGALLGDER